MKQKITKKRKVVKKNTSNKIDFGLVVNKAGTDKGSMDYMLKVGSKTNSYNKKKKSKLINSKNTIRPYGEYKKLLDMNWKQTKRRFPLISPYGDADFDGSYNKIDCKPLDPSRDGKFTDFLGSVVEKVKSIQSTPEEKKRFKAKTQKAIKQAIYGRTLIGPKGKKVRTGGAIVQAEKFAKVTRKAAGVPTTVKAVKGKKGKRVSPTGLVGRPSGQYKTRINPFTNQPIQIPATEYYKLVKKFKDQQKIQASAIARQTDTAQVTELARRGIPPEQAKQIVDTRQLESVAPEGYHVMQNGEPHLMKDTEMPEEVAQEPSLEPSQEQIEPKVDTATDITERMARLREIKEQKRLQRVAAQTQQIPTRVPQYRPQQQLPQRLPTQYQQPQTSQQYPHYQRPNENIKTDIMTGRRIVRDIKPAEKWIRPKEVNRVPVPV